MRDDNGKELCTAVIRLGGRVDINEREITRMQKHQNDLFKLTLQITKTITQVKYIAYGMAVMFVISQTGLTELLKKLL